MRITVAVNNPDKPGPFEFERMSVYEELGRVYRYDVFLLAESRDVPLSALLNFNLVVTIEIEPGTKRYFGGYVVKAVALGGHGRVARYQVELRPWLYLLRNRAMCRIWQRKTIVDVLKELGEEAGVSIDADSTVLAGRQWEYVVQYRESNFNFFMRLVEQEGLHFFFRQQATSQDLVLTDDLLMHDSAGQKRLIEFRSESSSHALVEDVFTHWTVQEQARSTDYELDEYDYKNARADMFVRAGDYTPIPTNGKGETKPDPVAVTFDYPGEYVDLYGGTELAMIRQQELRVDRQTATAQGSVRDIGAGSLFKLAMHHRNGVDAEYAVTAMNLAVEAASVESGKGGKGGEDFVFRGSFSVLNTTIPFRLKRTTPKPIIAGVQTAVVVGPPNEEIHTDDLGRVRVKFRWDRTGKENAKQNEGDETAASDDSSCWIRVGQPWASAGFGFQFIPRVGDEVIVQFLEGDPDRPLITGSVYSNLNTLPFALPSKKTQSGIKTRSSKKGGADNANIIRLEDEKGHEEFFVQAEKDHTVKVKNNRAVSVGGNETYNVTGTRSTEIKKKTTDKYMDERSEYVDKGLELTVKSKIFITQGPTPGAGTTLKFEGDNVELTVKGTTTITQGVAFIEIDSAGKIQIGSSAGVTISGPGGEIYLDASGIKIVGSMISLNS